MAQRTGAKRFLAPPAKTASAGIALALAVAALLLAGCGGGSSEDASNTAPAGSTGSTSSASRSASADPTSPGAGAHSKTAAGAGESPAGAQGAAGTSPGSAGSPAQGQKHGPRVVAPKGPPERAPTPQQVAGATVADISLQSPAILAANGSPGRLDATYTCDGKDSWPALRWGGVPAGTRELILYAMNVQPLEGRLFVDWALAGLDPKLAEIGAGELPKGAVVGTNGFGKAAYSLCPTGGGEIYMFALYALPQSLSLKRGFDAREARKQILDASGDVGLLPAVYERG